MDNTLTPEQKKHLDSWATQRDAILGEIAVKKTEQEGLTKINKELAASNTEISNKIQQSIGRLEELDRQEVNRATFVLKDVAELDNRKSVLQAEVTNLVSDIVDLTEAKNELKDEIVSATKVHETVFSRASDIERIITETVTINSSNAHEIKTILVEAGAELKKVIDIGKESVVVANRAIAEIPKIIVDLHRDVVERRRLNKHKVT